MVYPILLLTSALIANWFNPSSVSFIQQDSVTLIVNIIFLLIAVLGEEIGWHGVALPALQQKYSTLKTTLILGFWWGVWHIPFWLLLDTFDQFGILYLMLNFIFVLPMTFYMTWFFNSNTVSCFRLSFT